MRAITICQPYAHLIVTGAKRVENRTWPTRVTGPVAIHAGKSREWLELSEDGMRDEDYGLPLAAMSFGAVVGVADLVACLPIDEIRRGDHDARFPWLREHEHAEGPLKPANKALNRSGGWARFEVVMSLTAAALPLSLSA